MKINQDNYEQYFLDHAEGNLSPEMERELSDFLDANPDLKAVLEELDLSPVETPDINNNELKAKLRKHLYLTENIKEENIDEWMIRDIEGLLDADENNELKEFISQNPAFSFDYKLFGYTKLSPDLAVTYREKKELKKKVTHFPMRRLVWAISGVAALLLLILGIRYLSQPEPTVYQFTTPAIAATPSVSSQGTVDNSRTSSAEEKKILQNNKPESQPTSGNEHDYVYRLSPIAAHEIILHDQTSSASLNLADLAYSPVITADKKDRSLISKVFSSLVVNVHEGLENRPKLEKVNKSDFNFWSVAKAGINGFNRISDRELELYVRKDEAGNVKSYALVEEERLILSKDLNKN